MRKFRNHIVWLFAVWLVGCSVHGTHSVDSHPADVLNRKASAWRFRNLDSTFHYAMMAYEKAAHYKHGRIVACNMLGFVAFMQMDYEVALDWYEEVESQSGCELERLVADVGRMNVYLRTADNLNFYNCRVRATKRLMHIYEELDALSPAERERLQSTENDLYMVTALHHYMIGQRPEAHIEMDRVAGDEALRADSAQWLMKLYLKGIGLGTEGDTREQRILRRYSYLNNCLRAGRDGGYLYFEGLAASGLSELLADSLRRSYVAHQRPNSYAQLVNDSGNFVFALACDAQRDLWTYGDRYGAMNATIQIASLYNRNGECEEALEILYNLLDGDTLLVPDALCRLHEEASVAFAGMGDKSASDYHRNVYLDLLETTRQDKELESRYLLLKGQQRTMNVMLGTVLAGFVLLVVLIALLSWRRRNKGSGYEQRLRELLHETEKRVYLHQQHIETGKRNNVVRKATLSMLTGMMPYIDRMAHEVERLQQPEVWEDTELRIRKLEYMGELAEEVNHLNEVLAQWIKTTQGVVNLHIESFSLNDVLELISRSGATFAMKGITLEVQSTDVIVKADKALTFFMLNTLVDNARKFTPEGGRVVVDARLYDGYVELSVTDNGVGMSASDISHILCEKVYDASAIGGDLPPEQRRNKGGGFGLLNCKGIIEKYRKTDSLFDVCRLGVESRVGEGSRFWFRLPKGVRRLMALLYLIAFPSFILGSEQTESMGEEVHKLLYDTLLVQASAYADSIYLANVDGCYEMAICFADSAIAYLNAHYSKYATDYIAPLTVVRGSANDVETNWWLSDFATDYHTILDIRNELAVANLALRRWDDYRYNNRIYNDLYKLISEDRSLIDYCDRMQRYNSNISVAVLICVLLVLGYLALIIGGFMGRVNSVYRDIETVEEDERRVRHEENRLHVQNLVLDNCLSTIKHETVYYPSRIRQLVAYLEQHDERVQLKELVDYYKVVFTTLVSCASRQLDEVTFRRSEIKASVLLDRAAAYHTKRCSVCSNAPKIATDASDDTVLCDAGLVTFLLEQLIDASLAVSLTDVLHLDARADGDFIRFALTNVSRSVAAEVLQVLFNPACICNDNSGCLQGGEYIVCRQIIREHDAHFNHIGCRIKAEPVAEGGYTVWFTLPRMVAHFA